MILRSTLPGCIVLAAAFTFFHGAEQPALGQTKRQKAVVTAARSISRALQEGRIRQALGRAEKAVRQHPESGRLRTRRAQARLCLALQLDRDLSLALSEAALDRSLETALRFLRETGLGAVTKRGGEPLSALKEEQFRQLLQYVESDEVKGFRSAARKRIARALPLAEQRTSSLARSTTCGKQGGWEIAARRRVSRSCGRTWWCSYGASISSGCQAGPEFPSRGRRDHPPRAVHSLRS